MHEDGIELTSVVPLKLTDELASKADMLITMGCGEACPVVRVGYGTGRHQRRVALRAPRSGGTSTG